jgi:hypothetical protein
MRSSSSAAIVFTLAAVVACDGAENARPDAPLDTPASSRCPPCPLGSICVEQFDGTCGSSGPTCVTTTESCAPNTCSPACEQVLCPSPYQCHNRPPCGTEAVGAFNCYGP